MHNFIALLLVFVTTVLPSMAHYGNGIYHRHRVTPRYYNGHSLSRNILNTFFGANTYYAPRRYRRNFGCRNRNVYRNYYPRNQYTSFLWY